MARPPKKGMDYFPLDVDFHSDPKVLALLMKHGPEGAMLWVFLMCAIYREGWFVHFTADHSRQFAYRHHMQLDLVEGVIGTCCEQQLFHAEHYAQRQVLTSEAIQRRYLAASSKRRGWNPLNDEAWLLPEEYTAPRVYDLKNGGYSGNNSSYHRNKNTEIGKEGNREIGKEGNRESNGKQSAAEAAPVCPSDGVFPDDPISPSPATETEQWSFEIAHKPWAQTLKRARCKIGPRSWLSWLGLLESHFNNDAEALAQFAQCVPSEDRWAHEVETAWLKRNPQATQTAPASDGTPGAKAIIL